MRRIEFDLPIGYEDQHGAIHTHVTMRAPLCEDLFAVASDAEVKQIAATSKGISLPTEGSVDPVHLFLSEIAMKKMMAVLFGRIVEQVGDIAKPDRSVFRKLGLADFSTLEKQYQALIAEPKAGETDEGEATKTVPFASAPSEM